MPPLSVACSSDSLWSRRGCHAYCREITKVEHRERHTNPRPVHLVLSPPTLSLKNKLGFVVPVKPPESYPKTHSLFVAHIKWCLLSILSQILIFNHLLQRLYPNSLKGEGWKRGLRER